MPKKICSSTNILKTDIPIMEIQLAKQVISTFNKDIYAKFVHELWKILDYESNERTQKIHRLPEIGNDIFELQHIEGHPGLPSKQGFNLIIPFFQPIELFNNNKTLNFIDDLLSSKLKKYKKRIEERISDWQFWTHGDYWMPDLMFFTNYEGYEKSYYQDYIIPKFETFMKQIDFEYGKIGVGSIDSFFDDTNDKTNALKALKSFLSNFRGELSLSFKNGNCNIDVFSADKYLTQGVLIGSNSPYETIFIENNKSKSEIIKEFEFLLSKQPKENEIEKFITKYYKEIFGEKYDRIETQLWLKFPELDISNKKRRLDVFLRNSIDRDWELFELKRVRKMSTTYRDIPTLTCEILHSIQQIKNYEKILMQDKVKQAFAKKGIEYYYPELRLVVGNKPDISNEQWRFLKSTNENGLKIITFDDLIMEMKLRYNIHDKYLTKVNR